MMWKNKNILNKILQKFISIQNFNLQRFAKQLQAIYAPITLDQSFQLLLLVSTSSNSVSLCQHSLLIKLGLTDRQTIIKILICVKKFIAQFKNFADQAQIASKQKSSKIMKQIQNKHIEPLQIPDYLAEFPHDYGVYIQIIDKITDLSNQSKNENNRNVQYQYNSITQSLYPDNSKNLIIKNYPNQIIQQNPLQQAIEEGEKFQMKKGKTVQLDWSGSSSDGE